MSAAGVLLILTFLFCSSEADQIRINATYGKNIVLPCDATKYKPIKVLEWSRADDGKYVIIWKNQPSDPVIPETVYQRRVKLVDRENGDVSMNLNNVTTEDSGTYECFVVGGTKRTKREIQPVSTIILHVAPLPAPPGNKEGNRCRSGLLLVGGAGLSASVVLMVVLVLNKRKVKNSTSSPNEDVKITRMF